MIIMPSNELQSRRRPAVLYGIVGVLLLAASVLGCLLLASTKGDCDVLHHRSRAQTAPGSMSLQQLQALSEQMYQEMQAKQDSEIDALGPEDFIEQEALLMLPAGYKKKFIFDYTLPGSSCPFKEKLGVTPQVGDNGKWICGARTLLQKTPCIVYSFGSNADTVFEEDLLSKAPHCEVHVFDPTLLPAEQMTVAAVRGITFHPYGLSGWNENVTLGQHRVMSRPSARDLELKTLDTVMGELGHAWLDVFKMDIEGAEWGVLEGLLARDGPLPFTQMQVEYHVIPKLPASQEEGDYHTPRTMLHIIRALLDRGLRVFNAEPNYWWENTGHNCIEFAYLQVDSSGGIVTSMEEALAAGVEDG